MPSAALWSAGGVASVPKNASRINEFIHETGGEKMNTTRKSLSQ